MISRIMCNKLPTYGKRLILHRRLENHNEERARILTLWTFTVTTVPARPRSFWAAASPFNPATLSPGYIYIYIYKQPSENSLLHAI